MTSRRVWVKQLWTEQPGLGRGHVVDVATAAAMAAALVLGGRQRTVAVVWRTLNESGGPLLWGIVFAVVAVLLVVATYASGRIMMVALWLGAIPYALLGWWFLGGAVNEDSASFVGFVLCARTAVTHVSRADAYRAGSTEPGP